MSMSARQYRGRIPQGSMRDRRMRERRRRGRVPHKRYLTVNIPQVTYEKKEQSDIERMLRSRRGISETEQKERMLAMRQSGGNPLTRKMVEIKKEQQRHARLMAGEMETKRDIEARKWRELGVDTKFSRILDNELHFVSKELQRNGVQYLEGMSGFKVPFPSELKRMGKRRRKMYFNIAMKYIQENGLEDDFPYTMSLYTASGQQEKNMKTQALRNAQVSSDKISTVRPRQPASTSLQRTRSMLDKTRNTPDLQSSQLIPLSFDNSTSSVEESKNELAEDIMSFTKSPETQLMETISSTGISQSDANILFDKFSEIVDKVQNSDEMAEQLVSYTSELGWGEKRQVRALDVMGRMFQNPQPTLPQDNTGSMIPVNQVVDQLSQDAYGSGLNNVVKAISPNDSSIGENKSPDDMSSQNNELVIASQAPMNRAIKAITDASEPTRNLPNIEGAYDNAYALVYGDGYAGDNSALGSAGASEQVVEHAKDSVRETALKAIGDGEDILRQAEKYMSLGGDRQIFDDMRREGNALIDEGKRNLTEYTERKMADETRGVRERVEQVATEKLQEVIKDPSKTLDAIQQFGEVVKDPKGAVMKAGELVADEFKRRAEDFAQGRIPKDAGGVFDEMKGLIAGSVDDRKEGGHSEGAGGLGEIRDYMDILRETRHRRMVEGQPVPDDPPATPGVIHTPTPRRRTTMIGERMMNDDTERKKYTGSVKIARRPVQKISRKHPHNQVYKVQRGIAEYGQYKNVFNSTFA